jgi:hypothetical protein
MINFLRAFVSLLFLCGLSSAASANTCGVNASEATKIAAYSVDPAADENQTIPLGGSAFYSVTLGAPSGYAANFCVELINTDTGRDKWIVVTGGNSFWLHPLQTANARMVGGVWYTTHPNRWKSPGGGRTLNLYADYKQGNDANDCLAPGEGNACKSLNGAYYRLCDQVDFYGYYQYQTLANINLAPNTTDLDGGHLACQMVGQQGGASLNIIGGGGSSVCPTDATAIGVFEAGVRVRVQNVYLCSGIGDDLSAGLGATIYVMDNVQFGAAANAHMGVSDPGSHIIINGNYQIWGSANYHMIFQSQGQVQSIGSPTAPINVTWGAPTTFKTFALAGPGGVALVPNMKWNLNSYSSTGQKFSTSDSSLIYTGTSGDLDYFLGGSTPGRSNPAIGGFYD